MGKVLDLRVYEDSTFDLTLKSGEVLHVRKPSEALMLKIMSIENVLTSGDEQKIVAVVKDFLLLALGNNKEGIVVDDAWFEQNELDFVLMLVVFKAYAEFTRELTEDPNLLSPRSQTSETGTTQTTT